MNCYKCQSTRIVEVTAKSRDCFSASIGNRQHDGYAPNDLGIGGGDYIDFNYCMNCGSIQGTFPLPTAKLEIPITNEDILNLFESSFNEGQYTISNNEFRRIKKEADDLNPKIAMFLNSLIKQRTATHITLMIPAFSQIMELYNNFEE